MATDSRKKSHISSHFEISFSQIVNLAKKKGYPLLASAAPLLLFCPLFFAHSNVCCCSVGAFASVVSKVSCSAHSTTSAESFASQSIFPAVLASATRTETTQNGSEAEARGSRNSKKRNEKEGTRGCRQQLYATTSVRAYASSSSSLV